MMRIEVTISSKGQIVIPKDVRTALELAAGGKLQLRTVGRQIILEAPELPRERISYEEFRRRVPKYTGPPVAIDDMRPDFSKIWLDRE